MAAGSLPLLQKGCLGTCWYGKYHYLEPWVGCGHGCHYCYARFRSPVADRLASDRTPFESPRPLFPPAELLRRIAEDVKDQDVRIIKLCRYTDILSPGYVRDGLAWEVLNVLVRSPVQRIILTTKGQPDGRILALLRNNRARFSYNAALRPPTDAPLEPNLPPLDGRLAAAAELKRSGVLTTIHLDPLIAGLDDDPLVLRPLLERLRRLSLMRVMFSYLLLSDPVLARLRSKLPPRSCDHLAAVYDLSRADRYLAGQDETASYSTKPEIKAASVKRVAGALTELGFEFVLCSLKSAPGDQRRQYSHAHPCDGTFYA
jgi:DNA repair photolyase